MPQTDVLVLQTRFPGSSATGRMNPQPRSSAASTTDELGSDYEADEAPITNHRSRALNLITIALMCLAVAEPALSQEPKKSEAASFEGRHEIISKLRSAYAAFNRGDIDAAVAVLDPKIEWTEPLEFPGGGTYHGREAVKRYLTQSRAGWAEGSSEPERFITVGERIVVFVCARFRPRDGSEWQEIKLADVYSVRSGRIVQMRAFTDRQQALSWADGKIPNSKK